MPQFLIDSNLPYFFSLWKGSEYVHQFDLGESWTDDQIWEYARKNQLTVVSKDADFFSRILLTTPPPKVIHIKLGNMCLNAMHECLSRIWPFVVDAIPSHKLVVVYADRIEMMR